MKLKRKKKKTYSTESESSHLILHICPTIPYSCSSLPPKRKAHQTKRAPKPTNDDDFALINDFKYLLIYRRIMADDTRRYAQNTHTHIHTYV